MKSKFGWRNWHNIFICLVKEPVNQWLQDKFRKSYKRYCWLYIYHDVTDDHTYRYFSRSHNPNSVAYDIFESNLHCQWFFICHDENDLFHFRSVDCQTFGATEFIIDLTLFLVLVNSFFKFYMQFKASRCLLVFLRFMV